MRVHLAILQCASLLVPEQQRAEWLAEWRAELWHAWQDSHGANLLAYCFGSFWDAFWLRRYGPVPRSYGVLHLNVPAAPAMAQNFPDPPGLLESPLHCLSFLALLSVVGLAVAMLLPASREVLLPSSNPDSRNLVMLSPTGQRDDAREANGTFAPYPSVSVEHYLTLRGPERVRRARVLCAVGYGEISDRANGRQSIRTSPYSGSVAIRRIRTRPRTE